LERETEQKADEVAFMRQIAQCPVVRCRTNSVKSSSSFIKGLMISLLFVLSQSCCFSVWS